MKQIITVFRFTFLEAARKKAFLITTALLLVLILGASTIPLLIQNISLPQNDPDKTIYFIKDTEMLPGAQEAIAALYPKAIVVKGDKHFRDKYAEEVQSDADKAIIELTEEAGLPQIRVIGKTFMSFVDSGEVSKVLTPIFAREEMKKLGASDAIIALYEKELDHEFIMVGSMNLTGFIVGIGLLMIMFFSIYYYGYGISMSVASEKASRVMETLIVSAKPSNILIGKCLGMGVLGLAQLSTFLLTAATAYLFIIPNDFAVKGVPISLSDFSFSSALLILVYFVLGFSLYAMMNAVAGALVDKIEDLSSTMTPVILISMFSFYGGYFTAIMDVSNIFAKIVVYIPFTSPFVVPFKLLNSDVSRLDIALSIIALIVAVVLVTWISVRLYTASVLRYGKKLKIKEIYPLK